MDVGDRRIGVALSDPLGFMATPLTTIQRTSLKNDIAEVVRLVGENEAEKIIVGLPVSLSGEEGPQAKLVQGFIRRLSSDCSVPVVTWDERYSTAEAERRLRQAGIQPSRQKGRVDAAAAAIILQGWLDAQG